MRRVKLNDEQWFKEAGRLAKSATCKRAKCGAIVVAKDGSMIGVGYNAPVLEDEDHRYCDVVLDHSKKPKYDLTCCVHAEWSAILDACKKSGSKVYGASLYFMRVDDEGNFTDAGEPFCTVCSRLAMQSGIAKFGLWNGGPQMIPVAEYDTMSHDFYKK